MNEGRRGCRATEQRTSSGPTEASERTEPASSERGKTTPGVPAEAGSSTSTNTRGPAKDIFGGENQAACPKCEAIHPSAAEAARCADECAKAEAARALQVVCPTCKTTTKNAAKAAECVREHELEKLRDRARRFARTGVSQRGNP